MLRNRIKSFHCGFIEHFKITTTIRPTSYINMGGFLKFINSPKSLFWRDLRPISAVYSASLSLFIFSSYISDSISFKLLSKWMIILSFRDCNASKCALSIHLRTISSLGSSKKGRSSYWNRLAGIHVKIDYHSLWEI